MDPEDVLALVQEFAAAVLGGPAPYGAVTIHLNGGTIVNVKSDRSWKTDALVRSKALSGIAGPRR